MSTTAAGASRSSHSAAAPALAAQPAAAPTVWIEICRGRTQYPRRPLIGDRLLIGAGSSCQLQLGGAEMPFLHSLICREDEGLVIEAFVQWPELLVNGEHVRTATLRDGDRLSIGAFEFTIHMQPSVTSEVDHPLLAPVPLEVATQAAAKSPSELTAAELVEQIEAEEADVASWDKSQRAGLTALLTAVRQVGEESESPATIPLVSTEDDLRRELSTLTGELEQRLAELRAREQSQRSRAESLLSAQDRLAEQLKLAAQSLAQHQDRTRASA